MTKVEKTMLIRLKADLDHLKKGLKESQRQIEKTTGGLKNLGSTIKRFIGAALIIKFFKDVTSAASDAQEAHSKFITIFRNIREEAINTARNLSESYGLSTKASEEMLGATGDLLTGLGMASDKALELSEKTQKLAVDLASFTNYAGGAKGASDALTKAMLGEREMIKSLGIVVHESMIKERLLAEGKNKLTGLALMQAKAELTLKIAMEQSKNAIGDYARTSDSFANKIRLLGQRFEDFKVEVGKGIVESKAFNDVLNDLKELFESEDFREGIRVLVKGLAEVAGWIVKILAITPRLIGILIELVEVGYALERAYKTHGQMLQELADKGRDFLKFLGDTGEVSSEAFTKYYKALDKVIMSSGNAHQTMTALNKLFQAVSRGDYGTKLAEQWKKYRKEFMNFMRDAKEVPEKIKKINKEIKEQILILPKVGDITEYLGIQIGNVSMKLGEQKKKIKDTTDKIITFKDAWADAHSRMQLIHAMISGITDVLGKLGIKTDGIVGELASVGEGMTQFFMAGDPLSKIAGITKAIGGLIGAIKKLIKDGIDKAIKRQNAWMKLTKEMTKELKALAKQVGDTHAATSIMLDEIMRQSDITVNNFNRWANRVKEIFLDLDRGFLSQKEFMTEMGQAWNQLVVEAQRLGTEGSRKMIEIMAEMKLRGMEIAEINEYINKQMQSGLEGYKKYLEGEFSNVTIGVFEDMIDLQERMADNKKLIDGVKGLGEALMGLSATTEISQEAFTAFSTGATDAFDKLQEQGFSATESLDVMRDMLRRLAFLQGEFGYETDAATQSLLDLARQEGVLDGIKDPMIEIADVLKEIRDIFLHAFPQAVKHAASSIKSAMGSASNSMNAFMKSARGATDILAGETITPLPVIGAQAGLDRVFAQDTMIKAHKGERHIVEPAGQTHRYDHRKISKVYNINIHVREASNAKQLARELKTSGKAKKEVADALGIVD